MDAVRRAILLGIVTFGGLPAAAKEDCSRTWKKDDLKSYKTIEDELQAKLGDIKILQIELCAGTSPFFQVTILHNKTGKVVILKAAAK